MRDNPKARQSSAASCGLFDALLAICGQFILPMNTFFSQQYDTQISATINGIRISNPATKLTQCKIMG
ncbi:MAG: hypothetical protein R3Y10_10705 [Ferrimonas sp.]